MTVSTTPEGIIVVILVLPCRQQACSNRQSRHGAEYFKAVTEKVGGFFLEVAREDKNDLYA